MYCSDRCRHAAHRQRRRSGRAVTRARRPSDQQLPTAAPTAGGMAAWAAWARATYVIDETGEQLLRLAVEADVRYQQARAVLDAEGPDDSGRAPAPGGGGRARHQGGHRAVNPATRP